MKKKINSNLKFLFIIFRSVESRFKVLEVSKNSEEEKKRIDSLWADFLDDSNKPSTTAAFKINETNSIV